jgi:pimeloyl-ACP methyl ester carboxylesterase
VPAPHDIDVDGLRTRIRLEGDPAGRPVLLLHGIARDRILPPTHFQAAKSTFPLARSHMYPAIGHMPQIERPDEFAALVRDFHASLG